jgi:hypothetical protein
MDIMLAMVDRPEHKFNVDKADGVSSRHRIPEVYIFLIGLLWLTLAFAVFWGIRLSDEEHPYRLLWLSLVFFSPPSRFPVFVLWWITKTWGLGTHYDIFDSWDQALVGQLVYGSLVQIIPGGLLGSLTLAIRRRQARLGDGIPSR